MELQWKTKRKLHIGFQLVPVLITLNNCNTPPYAIVFFSGARYVEVRKIEPYYERQGYPLVWISVTYRLCISSQGEWPITHISRSRYS